jgi:hypothetical protein
MSPDGRTTSEAHTSSTTPKKSESPASTESTVVSTSLLILKGITFTPDPPSYIFSGKTLSPGSSITVGTTPPLTVIVLHINEPSPVIEIDSSSFTVTVTAPAATTAQVTLPPTIVVGSSTITANEASEYVVGSQTLSPGGGIDVSGTPITDIGGYVWMGLGGSSTLSATESAITNSALTSSSPLSTGMETGQPEGVNTSASARTVMSMEVIALMLALVYTATL